ATTFRRTRDARRRGDAGTDPARPDAHATARRAARRPYDGGQRYWRTGDLPGDGARRSGRSVPLRRRAGDRAGRRAAAEDPVPVQRPAVGVKPWRDSAVTPTLDHNGHASTFAGGVFGFAGPYDSYGPMLAYGVLGVPYGRRAHLPRADVNRGYLTPASTDYDALTQPRTVLAFLLVRVG